MSSVIYPVRGGMEDWAYGGGWDFEKGGTLTQCNPFSYSLTDDQISLTKATQRNVKSLIYLVETDMHK